MDLSKQDLFNILTFIKNNFTYEDIFLLALIILFLIEKKCDKLFIALLLLIFITGLSKDLFSLLLLKSKSKG